VLWWFRFQARVAVPVPADRPRVAGALYALWSSSRCSSCSSRILERFRFDPVGQLFLAERYLADRPPGRRGPSAQHQLLTDRPWMRYGPSACFSARRVILLCLTDRPPGNRGPSAPGSRTVRQGICRTAKSFASWFVLSLRGRLGFVPRVVRSIVTT
jgi:hypothetical protein